MKRVARLYRRRLRPHMPVVGFVRYGGVAVNRSRRLFDRVLPFEWTGERLDDRPSFESGLVQGLRKYVRVGDRVIVIGGGWGVTTVIASTLAGSDGSVVTYEGALECVDNVRFAVSRRDPAAPVDIHHAIVGNLTSGTLRGSGKGAKCVMAADIPDCDVLELDCEGAEVGIIQDLAVRPRVILVETHGMFDAPTAVVRDVLARKGYTIMDESVADDSLHDYCTRNDIRVLAAVALGHRGSV